MKNNKSENNKKVYLHSIDFPILLLNNLRFKYLDNLVGLDKKCLTYSTNGIGKKTISETEDILHRLGMRFGMTDRDEIRDKSNKINNMFIRKDFKDPIDLLDLSVTLTVSLRKSGLYIIEDIFQLTDIPLQNLKGVGFYNAKDIRYKMIEKGFVLSVDDIERGTTVLHETLRMNAG